MLPHWILKTVLDNEQVFYAQIKKLRPKQLSAKIGMWNQVGLPVIVKEK